MTATDHTEHYGLSQYTEGDRPTYTGDYNGDMAKIDSAIYAASQSGGLTSVTHTDDLTGDGSDGNPLGVADTIARSEDIPSLDGYATTESVTQAIASAIADRLTAGDIKSGNGINIETSGNTVTISYVGDGSAGGLSAVAHDATLTGDGTVNNPLAMTPGNIVNPISRSGDDADAGKVGARQFYNVSRDWKGLPDSNFKIVGATLMDVSESRTRIQCLFAYTDSKGVSVFVRQGWVTLANSPWKRLLDEGDLSAMTSRIAALESQVAALTAAATPSATGLTATQLDTQYSDNYNIVRAGTPTRNTESEDPSHE